MVTFFVFMLVMQQQQQMQPPAEMSLADRLAMEEHEAEVAFALEQQNHQQKQEQANQNVQQDEALRLAEADAAAQRVQGIQNSKYNIIQSFEKTKLNLIANLANCIFLF